jgi:hypothetical protein
MTFLKIFVKARMSKFLLNNKTGGEFMKLLILTIILITSFQPLANASDSKVSECLKNEEPGVVLIGQNIADQLVGTAIYNSDFMSRIHHVSASGDELLSISGIVKHNGKQVAIHGLLECNLKTGYYEFAGASTSSL